jgi:hypothetical protein
MNGLEANNYWSIPISHFCLCVAVADLWFVFFDGPDMERVFLCWLNIIFWRIEGISLRMSQTK